MMFSKTKRFTDLANKAPAVGQYDISKISSHSGALLFPKDKRFKDSGTGNDGHLLDISNCSTASTKSLGSLNNGVFVTPRKPCGKAKSKEIKANESAPSDEFTQYLSAKIVELQEEIDKLRAENEMLHKLKDGELTEDERHAMESNLTAVKDELEKLRKHIEDEMEKNKELVYQQSSYECTLETMQADLDLANTQVASLQQQINSLEQMIADITESREEVESQCTRLHGINMTLQEEKLAFQDRLEEIETNWKNACTTKEELFADLLSCRERHEFEIKSLEQSLKEKQSTVVQKLTEDCRSLEETVESYKNKIDQLKLEMDQSFTNKMETIDNLKSEKETLVVSLQSLEEEHEKVQKETLRLKEDISRKEEVSITNLRRCQSLEDQIAVLQRGHEEDVELLTKELKLTKTTLEKREVECQTMSEALDEMKTNYENVCQARDQLEHDLHVVKQDRGNVDSEIAEAQSLISLLRENEQDQRTIAETLATKLEVCNMTIENLNNMNTEYQNTILSIEGNGRHEIEKLQEQLLNIQEENRSLVAAEEKASKLKQEYGRRLLEAQKNLSQKEMELQSYKRDLDKFVEESEGQDSWKRRFEELEAKVSPFQEQLDAFELEKQAMLNRNTESQSEIDKLGHQYAKLLGHQNQKQKIRHVRKLIDENSSLKTEVAKLREEVSKEKFSRKRLDEKVAKTSGTRRFDPSLAFKHNSKENKENTPLKKTSMI